MDFINSLFIILKYRWLIIRNVFLLTFISLIISLLLTKSYLSTATVLPLNPEGGGITSLLTGISMNVFEQNVIIPETFRIILRSNSLKDSLITKFDLFKVYNKKYIEHVYKKIDQNVLIEIDKELTFGYSPIVGIKVSVIDESPVRSCEMANFYIDYLKQKIDELNLKYVNKKYNFVSRRHQECENDLFQAELEMKLFQDKYGIMELSEYLKLSIQNIAMLEVEKEELEIELLVLAASGGANTAVYQKINTNIRVIERKIQELTEGNNLSDIKTKMFYPQKILPELALEYLRLYRDVEIQSKIFEMIKIQSEQVKLQMSEDLPSVLVLDHAKPPTYKFKPKRIYIVLSGFIFSLFISVFYVFMVEFYYSEKAKNSPVFSKLNEIGNLLKTDLRKIKRK